MEPPAIEDSFERMDKYPTVVERYYSEYHVTPEKVSEDETHCVLIHTNRICLLTLAETHPIVQNKKVVTKIDFKISDKLDRTESRVVGKGKKGGQYLLPSSPLCFVECDDGSKYTVFSCIKGRLVEINQVLLNNFQLLVEKPLSHGYIAVVLPSLKDVEEQRSKFQLYRSCSTVKNDADEMG